MTDVAERRKRGQDKAGGWGETLRTVVYAVLIAVVVRTFADRAVQHPLGVDDPDAAGRRLSVRLQVFLRLQQALLPVLAGLLLRPHPLPHARARRRGGVQVSRRPGPGPEPHRLHQAHRRPAGRSYPGHQRHPQHQRQAGRAHQDGRLCAGRRRLLSHRHPLQRGAAQRSPPRDHREQRQRPVRQHAGIHRAAQPLLHDGRQSRRFARQPHHADAEQRPGRAARLVRAGREPGRPRRVHLLLARPDRSGLARAVEVAVGRSASAASSWRSTEVRALGSRAGSGARLRASRAAGRGADPSQRPRPPARPQGGLSQRQRAARIPRRSRAVARHGRPAAAPLPARARGRPGAALLGAGAGRHSR